MSRPIRDLRRTEPLPLPDPPEHLSARSKELWRAVIHRCKSPGRQALLAEALAALDRADEARRAIDAQGLTFTTGTTGAVHMNPLLKVEKDSRQLFASIADRLMLHFDPDIDGRL